MKPKLDIAKSWNRVSDSWQKIIQPLYLRRDLLWGPYGPWEKDAKLIPSIKGKRVLVAGCGSGPDAWWLARNGAKVIGIDISIAQLKHAQKHMKQSGLSGEFIRKDIDRLSKRQFRKNSFNLIVSNYAFQYVNNLPKLFRTLFYYLKPGGKFIFSLDHPLSSAIETERVSRMDYLNERIKLWSFSYRGTTGEKIPAYSYHRTISSIYNVLAQSGFLVEKIFEPKPTTKRGIGNTRNYAIAQRIPETIIFVSRKL